MNLVNSDTRRCRIRVDQRIIARTNRIITLNGDYAYFDAADTQPNERFARSGSVQTRVWDEEFIVGDIKNAAKCITQISANLNYQFDNSYVWKDPEEEDGWTDNHANNNETEMSDRIRMLYYNVQQMGLIQYCTTHNIELNAYLGEKTYSIDFAAYHEEHLSSMIRS